VPSVPQRGEWSQAFVQQLLACKFRFSLHTRKSRRLDWNAGFPYACVLWNC